MEWERGSPALWMETHHLEESCCSPAYVCISSLVRQCPPLGAGGVGLEGLEYVIYLQEAGGKRTADIPADTA